MNFDKDEDSLDVRFNTYKLKEQQIKWSLEEIKLKKALLDSMAKKITDLETRIFFAEIDRYVFRSFYEELDIELEAEFQELNHG